MVTPKAVRTWPYRRVFNSLKKGIIGLSLSQDAIATLGCEFRRVYRFNVETGEELAPDDAITPRSTPPPKAANEISPQSLLARTPIPPIGLLGADDTVRSETLKISMENIARTEAKARLGKRPPTVTAQPRTYAK